MFQITVVKSACHDRRYNLQSKLHHHTKSCDNRRLSPPRFRIRAHVPKYTRHILGATKSATNNPQAVQFSARTWLIVSDYVACRTIG